MRAEIILRIVDLSDGRWKFDIKAGMNDDEIRKLIGRIRYVENELRELLETEIEQITETAEFLREKKK